MRLAIMQPYFFPYLGHFSLIAACDEWIVFDTSQYTPKTWMNRNRILDPAGGWKWVTVPLAKSSIHMQTHEAVLADPRSTRRSILGHLSHYRQAPFYKPVCALVEGVFTDDPSLVRLNVRALRAVCDYIGLPFRVRICSELDLALPPQLGAGDWAREICVALGASDYVNPIDGRDLFEPATFIRSEVGLHFLHAATYSYPVRKFGFEPNLSILDVLMWNPPGAVRQAVHRYQIVPASMHETLAA